MGKLATIVLVIIIGLAGLTGYNIAKNTDKDAQSFPVGWQGESTSLTNSMLETANSSTTDAFATSSYLLVAASDMADSRMNISFKGSSTASVLNWKYDFSEDGSTWFGEDNNSTSGSTVTHASTTLTHSLQAVGTTTIPIYKNINLPDTISNFLKITFTVSSATGTLNAYIIK